MVKDRTNELQEALKALRESEMLYRSMFVNNRAVMILLDPEDGKIVDVNAAACRFYGYTKKEMCRMKISRINLKSQEEINKHMAEATESKVERFEFQHRMANGEVKNVEVYSGPILRGKNLLFSIIHDITERKRAEDALSRYVKTQEELLKEVNHRVKNNLAALISILHIEEDRLLKSGNQSYLGLLRDLTGRIRGLLTVHQLFSARNWQPIEVSHLCERIITSATSGIPRNRKFDLKINHSSILVTSSIAHHLTLIINELATNSVKHALGHRERLQITLNLSHRGNHIKILYSDNGPGFPEEFVRGDFSGANIGFELIRGIISRSLEGKLKLKNEAGAVAIITFKNHIE